MFALATLNIQELQQGLIDLEFATAELGGLGAGRVIVVSGGGGGGEVFEEAKEEGVAHKGFFEFEAGGGGGGLGFFGVVVVFGGVGGGAGDLEVEFAEEGFGEVGVLVAAFEDDAVEFILGDGDGPVCFFFAAAGESI